MFGGKSRFKCPAGTSNSLTLNLKLLSQLPCPKYPPTIHTRAHAHTRARAHTHALAHTALWTELCSTTVPPIFNPETGKLSVTLPSYSSGSLIDHKVLLILLLNTPQISPLLPITRATPRFGHSNCVPGLWEQAPKSVSPPRSHNDVSEV